jgi:hypothetical protein
MPARQYAHAARSLNAFLVSPACLVSPRCLLSGGRFEGIGHVSTSETEPANSTLLRFAADAALAFAQPALLKP